MARSDNTEKPEPIDVDLATPISMPEKLGWQGKLLLLVLLVLLPYLVALYVVVAAYLLPARLPGLFHMHYTLRRNRASQGFEHVPTTPGFYLCAGLETLLVLPVLAIALAHMLLVQLLAFVLFAPFGLCTGVAIGKNMEVIWDATHRLDNRTHWVMNPRRIFQLWRCLYGMYYRQGFWEWCLAPAWMVVLNPVLKYMLTTNVWLWDLETKWCNQWTPAFPDSMSRAAVARGFTQIVSHATLGDETLRREVDAACFCAHYATPPPGTEPTCLGMQYAPRKLSTNLTFTTHAHLIPGMKPQSDSGVDAIFAVELHYFNAWHPLTGYVEVNMQARSGGNRLEHPMWIVVPRTGYLGNKLYLGANKLFAEYSPQIHATILKTGTAAPNP